MPKPTHMPRKSKPTITRTARQNLIPPGLTPTSPRRFRVSTRDERHPERLSGHFISLRGLRNTLLRPYSDYFFLVFSLHALMLLDTYRLVQPGPCPDFIFSTRLLLTTFSCFARWDPGVGFIEKSFKRSEVIRDPVNDVHRHPSLLKVIVAI